MRDRDRIIGKVADIYDESKSFGRFWRSKCEFMDRLGLLFFYFGSILMLVLVHLWDHYSDMYKFTSVFTFLLTTNAKVWSCTGLHVEQLYNKVFV